MARTASTQRIGFFGASLLTLVGLIGASAPAQAGFFDQLFGGGQPQERPEYNEPSVVDAPAQPAIMQRRPARRVAADDKPVLQKPTDLMHDKTLQPGDAVMMKTGIHIYTGREGAVHNSNEFLPLDEASRVPPAKRTMLASMDGTRNDPLAKAAAPDTLASGRSAAVATPIVAGVKFTDKRGVVVRYVGP